MKAEELEQLPLHKVQELYKAYGLIIECIEVIAGSPYNVGANGEYWSAVARRNACRQVYQDRLRRMGSHGDGQ